MSPERTCYFQENKGRHYEKIDVDSWLTERKQDQKTQKLIEENFSFDSTIQNEKMPHRVTEQPGFSYLGGSAKKAIQRGSIILEPEFESPQEHRIQIYPPSLPQSEQQLHRQPSIEQQQHQRRNSNEMPQKKNSRDFLLSEFDAALKKFERTKVPDSLPLKDEDDESKDKHDPRPMVISPTLLKSNKIMDKTVHKAAPTKPLIISRSSTPSTNDVKAPLPSSAEKTKAPFPWLGGNEPRALYPQTKRVKHVDKIQSSGGEGIKSGVHGVQSVRSKSKTVETTSKSGQSDGNRKNVIVHPGVTEHPGKEVFPPEMVANKKASEGKKTYRMSASLRELQPKVLSNNPPKPPSPVKEVLKDFIKEREIKKTLNFDVAAWKSKVNESSKVPQRVEPVQHESQNKKIIDSFSSYDPPRIPVQKPLSFTETLKSSSVDNYDITGPPPSSECTQHSLLAELNSTVSPEPAPKSTISILQTGYQASPGKVSLEETASILSTSMELCQTYPDPSASRVSLVTSPSLDHVTTSAGHVSQLNQSLTVTTPSSNKTGHPQTSTISQNQQPTPEIKMEVEETMSQKDPPSTVTQSPVRGSQTVAPLKSETENSTPLKGPQAVNADLTPAVSSNHCVMLPDKNICSRHHLKEFLNFQIRRFKIKTEEIEPSSNTTVKVEVEESGEKKESPSACRSKRKSAIIASQNLVEKVYKVGLKISLIDYKLRHCNVN